MISQLDSLLDGVGNVLGFFELFNELLEGPFKAGVLTFGRQFQL